MILHHTTNKANLRSILRRGILTLYSEGKMPAVWLHTADKTSWAFLHCVKRHAGRIEDIVCITVNIPDELVKRSSADGLFYTLSDCPPEWLVCVTRFAVVAASPLEA